MVEAASKSKSFDEIFAFLTNKERQQMKENLDFMSKNADKYLSD
jgi:hypothetical protein